MNGRVVVSYAGIAHMWKEPTDEWLVKVITGRKPERMFDGSGYATMFGGENMKLTLGGICDAIKSAMEHNIPAQPKRNRPARLEVLIAGWTWPHDVGHGNYRPSTFGRMFVHSGESGTVCEATAAPSLPYLRTSRRRPMLMSIGVDSPGLLQRMSDRINAEGQTTEIDIERIVTEEIRAVARVCNSGVGTDLMSVYLPVEYTHEGYLRFLRDTTVSTGNVAYSPAVIRTGGMIMYPQVMAGNLPELRSGSDARPSIIKVEVLPPLPLGAISMMSSQARRLPR